MTTARTKPPAADPVMRAVGIRLDRSVGRLEPKRQKLPSPAGQRALLNIASGRGSAWGLRSMSEHGGLFGTMAALRRAGLLGRDENITPAGFEMLRRLKTPNV